MLVSSGHIIAIDHVNHDSTLSGDGVFAPLGVVGGGGNISWSDLSSKIPTIYDISDIEALSSTSGTALVAGSALFNTIQYVKEDAKPKIEHMDDNTYCLNFDK